jgi:hypothetical protein
MANRGMKNIFGVSLKNGIFLRHKIAKLSGHKILAKDDLVKRGLL